LTPISTPATRARKCVICPAGLAVATIRLGIHRDLGCGFFVRSTRLNPLCFRLAPVALGTVMFYSFTKRFTSLSHIVLGFALGIAPAAAWIAMRGSLDPRILWLTAAVTLWTAGFDIIYSCQDFAFDVQAGLFSLPRRFGIAGALWISRMLHVGMIVCLMILVNRFALGGVAIAGVAAVAGCSYGSIAWFAPTISRASTPRFSP
jgi:4-hydroxybenzoate polyprenyltransferase